MYTSLLNYENISDFLISDFRSNYLSEPSQITFDSYYLSYRKNFSIYSRSHYNRQTEEITEFIRNGDLDVLEVGAGCGSESIWFALNGAHVTAIDISDDRINCAIERRDFINKKFGIDLPITFRRLSMFCHFDSRYDIIWMEQTYHHLEPRDLVFSKIKELLKVSGKLVICEVNGWNPLLQMQFFIRRGFKTIVDYVDSDGNRVLYGNERITTPGAIAKLALDADLVVKKICYFRLLPNCNVPHWFFKVEYFILKFLPFLSTHFIMVIEKK